MELIVNSQYVRMNIHAFLLVLAMAVGVVLCAEEAPGRFAFHTFPPAQGQGLGTASRPVPNGRGGFWFLNQGAIWAFDGTGYRALGPADGLPEGGVEQAHPEPSSGMWFLAAGVWRHLGPRGLRTLAGLPAPGPNRSFLAVRNEGFGVIEGDSLRIYGPGGGEPVVLPSPGAGTWTKGWKDPRSGDRFLVGIPGLASWDGTAWRVQGLRGFLEGRPWDVQRDRDGALWVRSDRDLVRVQPGRARFGPRLGFSRNSFVSLEEDPFGRMWTNGPEGLVCVEGDTLTRVTEKEGLYGYHSYWPIAFDREGSLWTISASGFQRMKGGFLWYVQEQPQGLLRAMVFTVSRLRDRLLYAGTHDGLYRRGQGPWSRVAGTEGWALFSMAERPGGELWTCGNPPWVDQTPILRLRPGRSAEHPPIQGLPAEAWGNVLRWTGPDELWCGTTKGLFRIQAKGDAFTAQRVTLPGADPALGVNWLERTPDGTLWAAADQGFFRRTGELWQRMGVAEGLAADDAVGTFTGPGGELWVLHDAARDITRLAYTPAGGWKVAGHFGKDHPLTDGGAKGGWTDPEGIVWLLSGNAVVRWDGRHAEHHTKAFGVPIDDFFENGIYGEADGHLWVGSISGLVSFEPRFYRPIPNPPALEGFTAEDGEGRSIRAGQALGFRRSGVAFNLQLPLVEGVEDLTVTARLKGLDDRWRPVEGGVLRFPGLPPGTYVLEARTARQDGYSGPLLSFPFTVLRPWFLRSWALALWAALLAGLAVLATLWRTWSLQRDRDHLEGVVSLRTSELVHTNADLTRALAEVKTLSGLVPICCYCKKIRDDDGFWSQLERYIQERSHAQFSHGICPDCEQKAREDLELAARDLKRS